MRPEEVDVCPGRMHEDRDEPGEDEQREPRRLEARMQPPEDLGQLPVGRHRVRDPRRADHAGVRGDEQDRRGEDPDVDLRRVQHRAVQAEVVDEAEHRDRSRSRPRRRQPEQRRSSPSVLLHRQRGERDQRQREVDREDGARDQLDRTRDVSRRVARLLGEVRDGLDAGVGDHRDRDREREVRPRRRDAPVDVRGADDVRAEDRARSRAITSRSCVAKSTTASRTFSARRLLDRRRCSARRGATTTITPPTMSQGFSRSGSQKIER